MSGENQNKTQRTDDEASPPQLLSANEFTAPFSAHRDDLINILRTERDPGMNSKLRAAITCFRDAFHKVSIAYSYALGSENTAKNLENNINSVIDYVRTHASLDVISTTVKNVASTQDRSYASIVNANSNTQNSGK